MLIRHATDRVSLEWVASEVGVSRFHACRVFAAEVGTTMKEYLHIVRISEALFRLAEGARDLTALGLDLGYSSHSHFTSVFRRLVGLPPSRVWARVRGPAGGGPSQVEDTLWPQGVPALVNRGASGV